MNNTSLGLQSAVPPMICSELSCQSDPKLTETHRRMRKTSQKVIKVDQFSHSDFKPSRPTPLHPSLQLSASISLSSTVCQALLAKPFPLPVFSPGLTSTQSTRRSSAPSPPGRIFRESPCTVLMALRLGQFSFQGHFVPWGHLAMSGDFFLLSCLKGVLLASSGQRLGLLPNIQRAQDNLQNKNIIHLKMSVMTIPNILGLWPHSTQAHASTCMHSHVCSAL